MAGMPRWDLSGECDDACRNRVKGAKEERLATGRLFERTAGWPTQSAARITLAVMYEAGMKAL